MLFGLVCSAEGDPNIDADPGGGELGDGTVLNKWSSGDDGVRVTVIEEKTRASASRSVDFANKNQNVNFHFGKINKIHYTASKSIKLVSGSSYNNIVPDNPLPSIISGNGQNNVEAIKAYFSKSGSIENICAYASFDYDKLISGDYVLLIEPIAYFLFNGVRYAGTATEIALFDVAKSRGVAAKMGSLTHFKLPRSMYLAKPALGFSIPSKPFPYRNSNAQIIDTLGLGTVHFKPAKPPAPPLDTVYRTNTDVIISVNVEANREYNPDDMGAVTFNILGNSYTKYFVCPDGGEQLVWIRWHTPSTPQPVTINITGDGYLSTNKINATIVDPEEVEPPDPQFGDGAPRIESPSVTSDTASARAAWNVWEAEESGDAWDFNQVEYYAKLETKLRLVPNARVHTAFNTGYGNYDMKSGYGVSMQYVTSLSYWCSDYDITNIQTASATFPEFSYKTFNRLLAVDETRGSIQTMAFKPNEYSYYLEKAHFTPLRFPDNTVYSITVYGSDMWTPAGELKTTTSSNNITINGNVYDDWYVRPLRE